MHQAMGGAQGQASDVAIAAREIMRLQELIRDIIMKQTGQPMEKSGFMILTATTT